MRLPLIRQDISMIRRWCVGFEVKKSSNVWWIATTSSSEAAGRTLEITL